MRTYFTAKPSRILRFASVVNIRKLAINSRHKNPGMPKGIFGTFGFEGSISENFQKKLGYRTVDCMLQE